VIRIVCGYDPQSGSVPARVSAGLAVTAIP